MYLIYVDESGDPGNLPHSPSPFFVLSGLVLHAADWHDLLDDFIDFRKQLKAEFGLRLREEIHAAPMLSKPGGLSRIDKHLRLAILRKVLDWVAARQEIKVLTVRLDKTANLSGYSHFEFAWRLLIQRFENTLSGRMLPQSESDARGMIFPDSTNGGELARIMREMRVHNPIARDKTNPLTGFQNQVIRHIVEDPLPKDSAHSYFLQIVDVIAYFAYQKHFPNSYLRKKGGGNYYDRLMPVLDRTAVGCDALGMTSQ